MSKQKQITELTDLFSSVHYLVKNRSAGVDIDGKKAMLHAHAGYLGITYVNNVSVDYDFISSWVDNCTLFPSTVVGVKNCFFETINHFKIPKNKRA